MQRFLPLICCVLAAAGTVRAENWKLVWADEFEVPGRPDPAKWSYEEGFIRNQESQFYTRDRPENARVEDGMLVIEGRKETYPRPGGGTPASYTSASLTTEGKAGWSGGRVEVRAKLPRGKGMWPAIWTLGENIHTVGWPRCGEIDIMEWVGKSPEFVYATLHYATGGKHASNQGKIPAVNPSEDFHTYAVEWRTDHLDFFLDGRKYHTSSLEGKNAGEDDAFHKPHYLILNLALGGSWGGQIDDAALPQKYLIDYVRVYQPASGQP